MLDPFAFDARWTLLLGVPVIAVLLALAWRKTRALAARIRAVREEMARNPQDPYQMLASLMAEDAPKPISPKQARRSRWPKE